MENKLIKPQFPEYRTGCIICGLNLPNSQFPKNHKHNEFYLIPIGFALFIIGMILVKILV